MLPLPEALWYGELVRRSFLLSSVLLAACAGGSSEDTDTESTLVDSAEIDSSQPSDSSTSETESDAEVDSATEETLADSSIDSTATDSTSTDEGVDETGDALPPWPSCDAQPTGTATKTIPTIWTDNPATPAFDWISGSIVTAVSQGGCSAGKACQLFLQEASGGVDLAAVSHHAIKLFVSAKAADRFTGIAVNDKVDVAGYAVRYTLDGQNELLVEVNDLLRGCIKKTGTGAIAPVPATLSDLSTVSAYESTLGPVLVTVSGVSGKPTTTSAIFGLYPTTGFDAGPDGGTTGIVSLSPYFLSGGAFTGLTLDSKNDFATITAVFGLFYPGSGDAGPATKYLVIYPRVMSEVVLK
jgi:hypothetical protein